MTRLVIVEVVAAEIRDVQQPFDEDVVERDEEAEGHHCRNAAGELLADAVLHEVALEEGDHVAGGVVGAALGHRAVQADLLPVAGAVLLAAERGLDAAVDQQVGVAPDRRGEVGVGLVGEAEVADVVRAVHRLLQRAQHHRLQQLGVGAVLDLLEQLGEVARARLVATAEPQAELLEELAQLGELVLGRRVVDAVQRRMLAAGEKVGCAHVGGEHALLDEAVGVVAHLGHDLRDLAVVVEDHAGFGGLEVDRAALGTRLQQHAEELVEVLEVGQQGREFGPGRRIVLVQRRRDLGVGQARVRPDHRGVEAVVLDLAGGRDRHVGHHGKALDLRVERAQAVGELLGQHRDDAAREVHRVAAVEGVLVERAGGVDIVRDVGDGDDQAVALALALAIHRVVEVLGGLPVDGDERQLGEVLTPGPVLLAHRFGQLARLRLGLGRELEGQVVLAQRDLDLHAGVGIVAEHLDDAADRLGELGGLLDQLDGNDLARLGLLASARGDQDVLRQATVLGDDDHHAVLVDDAADDTGVGALEHLDQLALGAAAAVGAGDAHHDAVAVQYLAHLLGAEEDVGLAVVAAQEAEAVGMTLDTSLDQVGLGRQQVGVAAVAHDLAVALHGAQAAVEEVELVRRDVERSGELGERHRHAALGEKLQHVLAARQRVVVLLGLALVEGVGETHGAGLRCARLARGPAATGAAHGRAGVVGGGLGARDGAAGVRCGRGGRRAAPGLAARRGGARGVLLRGRLRLAGGCAGAGLIGFFRFASH